MSKSQEQTEEASTKIYDLLALLCENHKEGLVVLAYTAARIIKSDKGPVGIGFIDTFAKLVREMFDIVPPIPTAPSTN